MASLDIAALRDLVTRQQVVLEINRAVARELDRRHLFSAVRIALRRVATFSNLGLMIPRPEDGENELIFVDDERELSAGLRFPSSKGSLIRELLETPRQVVAANVDEVDRYPIIATAMRAAGIKSGVLQPLVAGDQAIGVMLLMSSEATDFADADLPLLDEVSPAIARALAHCMAHEENLAMRADLAQENVALRGQLGEGIQTLTGESLAMRSLRELIDTVAPTDAAVLITGETGTGKELVADRIHRKSRRSGQALVKVNCAAIAAGVVESTLFGHEAGAFTGAVAARPGRFEAADGGTLLLDEVGELSLGTQAKLLRVLQSGEFERVGSSDTLTVDVRVLAATNRDLHTMIGQGSFRADLFHRLSVFPIELTPLRERRGDIGPLARTFVERMASRLGRAIYGISDDAVAYLSGHHWPGNVRELQNAIERAVLLCRMDRVSERCVQHVLGDVSPTPQSRLDDVLKTHMEQTLHECNWVVEGAVGAAARLGIASSTLRSRMSKLGIERPEGDRA